MIKLNSILRAGLAAAGCCCAAGAQAGFVNYAIVNAAGGPSAGTSGYADLNLEGITMDGSSSTVFAGGIQIAQNPGNNNPTLPNTYTTICTDIGGTVFLGQTYNYNAPTAFSSSQGVAPTWGADNTQTYLNSHGGNANMNNANQAIQNAAYIFYHFGGANLSTVGLTTAQSGLANATTLADIQLAVWEALYDTMDSGKVVINSPNSRFATSDGAAQTTINGWLTQLNDSTGTGNVPGSFGYLGYLLYPTQGGNVNSDGNPPQELMIASSAVTPVPEPTTMIAGAFLFIPFGMSTLRFLRKSPTV